MQGYILTYSRLYIEHTRQLWVPNGWDINFCVRITYFGRERRTNRHIKQTDRPTEKPTQKDIKTDKGKETHQKTRTTDRQRSIQDT